MIEKDIKIPIKMNNNMLEFKDVNEFDKYYSSKLLESSKIVSTNEKNIMGYKDTLGGEVIQQFFKIVNPKAVVGTWENHKGFKWWVYGELISEFLNLEIPIMYKYKPEFFAQHYQLLEDNRMPYGYGSRWSEFNQLVNVYKKLKDNPNTKRAVIDIFTPYDTTLDRNETPCTTMYHFIHREGKLNMTVMMRSWDFFGGAKTYDFALSSFVLQSMCSWLNMKPGELGVYANSLHYYNRDRENLEKLVAETNSSDKHSKLLELNEKVEIGEFYNQLRRVKDCEEAAYNENFSRANEIKDSININLFKDMCDVWVKKNTKC